MAVRILFVICCHVGHPFSGKVESGLFIMLLNSPDSILPCTCIKNKVNKQLPFKNCHFCAFGMDLKEQSDSKPVC